MSELSALEGLRQCLLPGDTQDGIDLEVPSWLVRKAADEIAALEVALSECQQTHGAVYGQDWSQWKLASERADELQARCERYERALGQLSDPMAYEHIGKFHGRFPPWRIAKEALSQETDK
jgi:hypothetical protein